LGGISKPLTDLLKKGALFIWTQGHDTAFQTLKSALCSAPVLAVPDFTKPFCIETDACGIGVGAVLMQSGHPLAYLSKDLGPRSQDACTYEKEYLAILLAVDQWRAYLQHEEFHIYTDHKSLSLLSDQRLHTHWQKKVFTKLLGLQYKIVYKQGVDNRAADALSRNVSHSPSCAAISYASPQWLEDVVASYEGYTHVQAIIAKLVVQSDVVPHFSWKAGLLRYKNRIWVGHNPVLHKKIIAALHDSAVGGHSGVAVTYSRIKHLFAWTGLRNDVEQYVKACVVCQQAKPDRAKLLGLLQPLPVPAAVWQVVSLDFIEALPLSGGYNCILVVVDFFSKYAHFLGLKHPFTAATVAQKFLTEVYRLHGLPVALVSDRDKIFTSKFWKELFHLADVQLRHITAYHPQSDDHTERLNQCLETFLRCFVHSCPSK